MRVLGRPLLWILALALFLRLWGVGYALPQFFVNDERAGVYGALKMLELKTLVPAWHEDEFRSVLYYLPLPSYLYLAVLGPVLGAGYLVSGAPDLPAYQHSLVLDPTLIFLAARALIALLGTASVYLAYRLGRAMFSSERAGLLAAIFLAVSFYHVQLSHVTRHWMPALVALELAWLASVSILRRGWVRDYLAAGLLAGLGVGANTAAAAAIVPAGLAHFFRPGQGPGARLGDRRLWLMALAFAGVSLAFVALYPYGLTQGEVGSEGAGTFLSQKLERLSSKSVGGWLGFLGYYGRLLFTYETALALLALGGGAIAVRRYGRWLAMAAVFVLGYLSLLYLFFNIIQRGVLFILPVLAVFAGYAADRLLLRLQSSVPPTRRGFYFLFSIFFLVLFGWPLAVTLRYDYLLAQPDTRLLAADWLYGNTPADAKILAHLPYLRLANTKAGIRTLEGIDPSGLRVQDRALLQVPDERYPGPSREVLNLHFVSPENRYRQEFDKRFFTAEGYRFFIVEYDLADRSDLGPQAAALVRGGALVARFAGSSSGAIGEAVDISGEIAKIRPRQLFDLERFGKFVDVYEL